MKSVKYSEFAPKHLEKIAAQFEREFVPTQPLTRQMATAQRKSKRKVGRPRIGLGAEKVRISLEKQLLRQADSFAHHHGLSRSELIATSLRAVMASAS